MPEAGSLDDKLGAVYDRMMADEPAVVDDAPEAEPVSAPEPVAPEQAAADDRARDEKGRFAPKTGETPETTTETPAAAAPEKAAPAPAISDPGKTVDPSEPASQPTIAAPQSWSPAAKAEWTKLPEAIRKEVAKREADVTRGFQQYAERVKSVEPVIQALEPVRQAMELNGVQPAQYVQRLVAAEQFLQRDPGAALKWLADQYGVPLGAQTQQAQGAEQAPASDPHIAALVQRQQQLEAHIQSVMQERQTEAQRRAEAERTDLHRTVETFAADPAHLYFENVRGEMAALLQVGRAADMKQAYEMACWANPEVRAQILRQEDEKRAEAARQDEARKRDEQAKKAAEARKLAGINVRGSGASLSPSRARNLDETLEAAATRIYGG
jgi:hypothetical protein